MTVEDQVYFIKGAKTRSNGARQGTRRTSRIRSHLPFTWHVLLNVTAAFCLFAFQWSARTETILRLLEQLYEELVNTLAMRQTCAYEGTKKHYGAFSSGLQELKTTSHSQRYQSCAVSEGAGVMVVIRFDIGLVWTSSHLPHTIFAGRQSICNLRTIRWCLKRAKSSALECFMISGMPTTSCAFAAVLTIWNPYSRSSENVQNDPVHAISYTMHEGEWSALLKPYLITIVLKWSKRLTIGRWCLAWHDEFLCGYSI